MHTQMLIYIYIYIFISTHNHSLWCLCLFLNGLFHVGWVFLLMHSYAFVGFVWYLVQWHCYGKRWSGTDALSEVSVGIPFGIHEEKSLAINSRYGKRQKDKQSNLEICATVLVGVYKCVCSIAILAPTWTKHKHPKLDKMNFLNLSITFAGSKGHIELGL